MDTGKIFYLRHFKSYELNHVSYIDWAIEQIRNGHGFDELYELAGLYRNHEYSNLEIERYFISCIEKLRIIAPSTEEEVLIQYCCSMCKTIVTTCTSIEDLEFLVAEMCNNFEDYYFIGLEPLWHLSVDLSIVAHNGTPEHYEKMNKGNALSVAKKVALEYFMKHA